MSDAAYTIDIVHLAVEAVPTLFVAAFAYIGKKFINDQEAGVTRLEAALKDLTAKFERQVEEKHGDDITLRMLSEGLERVEKESNLNRERYHELSQVMTYLRGRLEMGAARRQAKTGEYPVLKMGEGDE
jgi:hypothetical protein